VRGGFGRGVLIPWAVDGFQQFNKKYGQQLPDGTYQVPARWQAGLSNVSAANKIYVKNVE
jgi:hypothetical protein